MEATTAAKKITGKKLVLRYIGKTTEIVQVASDVLVAKDSIMFLEMIDNVGRLRSVWYSLDGLESFTYEGDLKYLAEDKTIKISPNILWSDPTNGDIYRKDNGYEPYIK